MRSLRDQFSNMTSEKRDYALRSLPRHLADAKRVRRLFRLLTHLAFLETKIEALSVYELATDFTLASSVLIEQHPQHRIVKLLEEAIRRDIDFIARHPTTLFQCLWNSCWWYDCPDAEKH